MSPSRAASVLLNRLLAVDRGFDLYGWGKPRAAGDGYKELAEAALIARRYNWRAELLKEKGGRHA